MQVSFCIPWPPSANRYWRKVGGRIYVSPEAVSYKKLVKHLLIEQKINEILLGRLSIEIEAFPPDKRKRDVDNLIKIVLDSLENYGLFENDSQIDDIHIKRMPMSIPPKGELYIKLEEISQ